MCSWYVRIGCPSPAVVSQELSNPFFQAAFFAFPILCRVLSTLVEINDNEFDIINEQFTPGVGILYGTFVALT